LSSSRGLSPTAAGHGREAKWLRKKELLATRGCSGGRRRWSYTSPQREHDLGVDVVEEALVVDVEAVQPDGLELRQSGLRRRGRGDKDGG